MFDHEAYNKSLTEHRDYKCRCIINKLFDLYDAVSLIYDFTNENVRIEFNTILTKDDSKLYRLVVTYYKKKSLYNIIESYMYESYLCTAKNDIEYFSLSQDCIPYFWNIGFNGYKLTRLNADGLKIHIRPNVFILHPKVDLTMKFIKEQVNYLNERGLVVYK